MGVLLILAILLGIVGGYFLGRRGVKIAEAVVDKKLVNEFHKVINGERENKIEVNGKIINVNRFKMRSEKDKDILIDIVNPDSIEKEQAEKELAKQSLIPEEEQIENE